MSFSPYKDLVISMRPSLYWPLWETTGTQANDWSGQARHGTYVGEFGGDLLLPSPTLYPATNLYPEAGGAPRASVVSPIASLGIYELLTAVELDGVEDEVTSTSNPFTNGTVRTFCGWIYRDTSGSVMTVFGSSDSVDGPQLNLGSANNNVNFYSDRSSTVAQWADAWPGNGQWVLCALEFNETTNDATLYLNGQIVSTITQSVPYSATPGNFQIGMRGASTEPLDGKIAHVAVFERALGIGDVLALYKAGASGFGATAKVGVAA